MCVNLRFLTVSPSLHVCLELNGLFTSKPLQSKITSRPKDETSTVTFYYYYLFFITFAKARMVLKFHFQYDEAPSGSR